MVAGFFMHQMIGDILSYQSVHYHGCPQTLTVPVNLIHTRYSVQIWHAYSSGHVLSDDINIWYLLTWADPIWDMVLHSQILLFRFSVG